MKKRVITALLIIISVIPALVLGGFLLDLLVFLVVVVGGFELVQVMPKRDKIPSIAIFLLFFSVALSSQVEFIYGASLIAILLLCLFAAPVFYHEISSDDAFYLIAVVVLLYTFAYAFLQVYNYNYLYIWYIMIATYASDTGAYLVGSLFGKTKLIPEISPKKTVEGAMGGWFFGFVLSLLFGLFIVKDMNIILLVVASLILPIFSQIGDLSFSAMKRHYKIKDFSNIFPGHGGFMDRIDSLVFNVLAFAIILVYII